MSEPLITPLELIGDADSGICVDGVCALPDASLPEAGLEESR